MPSSYLTKADCYDRQSLDYPRASPDQLELFSVDWIIALHPLGAFIIECPFALVPGLYTGVRATSLGSLPSTSWFSLTSRSTTPHQISTV